MKRSIMAFLLVVSTARPATTAAELRLPPFPLPVFVDEGGRPKELTSTGLLREMFRGGVHIGDNFDTSDTDYALLRQTNVAAFAAWLELACQGFNVDLLKLRGRMYDAGTFSRLLSVAGAL